MGHLVNPKLFRLNFVIFWSSSLLTKKKFSSYFDIKNIFILDYLNLFFKSNKNIDYFRLFIFNIKLTYVNNSLLIFLIFKQQSSFKLKIKNVFFKNFKKIFTFLFKKNFSKNYTIKNSNTASSLVSNFLNANLFFKKKKKFLSAENNLYFYLNSFKHAEVSLRKFKIWYYKTKKKTLYKHILKKLHLLNAHLKLDIIKFKHKKFKKKNFYRKKFSYIRRNRPKKKIFNFFKIAPDLRMKKKGSRLRKIRVYKFNPFYSYNLISKFKYRRRKFFIVLKEKEKKAKKKLYKFAKKLFNNKKRFLHFFDVLKENLYNYPTTYKKTFSFKFKKYLNTVLTRFYDKFLLSRYLSTRYFAHTILRVLKIKSKKSKKSKKLKLKMKEFSKVFTSTPYRINLLGYSGNKKLYRRRRKKIPKKKNSPFKNKKIVVFFSKDKKLFKNKFLYSSKSYRHLIFRNTSNNLNARHSYNIFFKNNILSKRFSNKKKISFFKLYSLSTSYNNINRSDIFKFTLEFLNKIIAKRRIQRRNWTKRQILATFRWKPEKKVKPKLFRSIFKTRRFNKGVYCKLRKNSFRKYNQRKNLYNNNYQKNNYYNNFNWKGKYNRRKNSYNKSYQKNNFYSNFNQINNAVKKNNVNIPKKNNIAAKSTLQKNYAFNIKKNNQKNNVNIPKKNNIAAKSTLQKNYVPNIKKNNNLSNVIKKNNIKKNNNVIKKNNIKKNNNVIKKKKNINRKNLKIKKKLKRILFKKFYSKKPRKPRPFFLTYKRRFHSFTKNIKIKNFFLYLKKCKNFNNVKTSKKLRYRRNKSYFLKQKLNVFNKTLSKIKFYFKTKNFRFKNVFRIFYLKSKFDFFDVNNNAAFFLHRDRDFFRLYKRASENVNYLKKKISIIKKILKKRFILKKKRFILNKKRFILKKKRFILNKKRWSIAKKVIKFNKKLLKKNKKNFLLTASRKKFKFAIKFKKKISLFSYKKKIKFFSKLKTFNLNLRFFSKKNFFNKKKFSSASKIKLKYFIFNKKYKRTIHLKKHKKFFVLKKFFLRSKFINKKKFYSLRSNIIKVGKKNFVKKFKKKKNFIKSKPKNKSFIFKISKAVNFIFLKSVMSKLFIFKTYFYLINLKYKLVNKFNILFAFKIFLNFFIFIKKRWGSFVNSDMISELFILRLKQKKLLVEVLKPVLRYLNKSIKKKIIYGYAILLLGRFSRKDRATYKWHKKGPFTKSNRLIFIDYSNKKVILKFSLCSFKISLIKSLGYKKNYT